MKPKNRKRTISLFPLSFSADFGQKSPSAKVENASLKAWPGLNFVKLECRKKQSESKIFASLQLSSKQEF